MHGRILRRGVVAVCVAFGTLACRTAPKEDSAPSEEKKDDAGFGLPFAKMLADSLDKPGPYDELRHSANYAEGVDHFAVLEIDRPIDELETISLFGGGMVKPLRTITSELSAAQRDDHVKGLLVRTTGLALDMATAEELRTALLEFRGAGKTVACHTEGIANAGYYVLTACDTIGLAPLGEVAVTGAAATPIHIKGLLDTIGVQADFLHVGAYKGAAEPLTRDAPSPEMLETLEAIVQRQYDTLVDGIVQGRKLSRESAVAAIDEAIFVDAAAQKAALVDTIATWEDFVAATTGETAWSRIEKRDDDPFSQMLKVQRFIGLLPPERPSGSHVALVYAVGNVIDGKGNGILGARDEIASRTLVATLRALARDESVKAVVLRVSSPGGSALASEQIWAAVASLRERKPVVVSMGGVAASGGYFIASGATKIYADATTLTGSIGVVGGKIVAGEALERIGIKTYEVHRGRRALLWSAMDRWSDDERKAVQDLMEATYERFVEHVAAGRKLDRDAVHAIAQGRVWTGADAKDKGLVDELGGLHAAIAEARRLAEIPDDVALEVYPGDPTLRDLFASFGNVQAGGLLADIGALGSAAGLATAPVAAPVRKLLRLVSDLRDTHVWAVSPLAICFAPPS